MSIQTQFEQFYKNIQLTSSQREDAKKKHNGVCSKLHDYYYPTIEYTGNNKLLIGSYGKHTNIRPPRDVDVLFIMPNDKFPQYDDNESNGQSQLLQDIRNILSEKYSTTDKIKGWGRVVLIKFADGTHNVELLPAWEQNDGKFIIPNTEKGGFWEVWDPRSEIQRINDSDNATGGKTRLLVRVIKKWSENCSVILKSFEIESKVVDFLSQSMDKSKECSILVRDFLGYFRDCARDEARSHLGTAYNRASRACDLEENGEIDKATGEWKKIFGDDFPSSISEASIKLETDTPALADYSHCEAVHWPCQAINRVTIDAYVYAGDKERKFGGINSNGRSLSSGLYLKFVASTNTDGPFHYYWQVVNTGEAARLAGDLRGKIFDDNQVRWEHTKYPGKHWIECFIVRDGICVARSGKFFVNIR